jgi:hypothetical protein
MLRVLLLTAIASPAVGFMVSPSASFSKSSLLLRSTLRMPLPSISRPSIRPGVCSIHASIDRRTFLAAAGALFSQIDVDRDGSVTNEELENFFSQVSIPSLPAADSPKNKVSSSAPKKEIVDKIANGLLRLSNQNPFDEKAVALFSDGSDAFKAAELAVKQVGGTPVIIDPKSDIDDIRLAFCLTFFSNSIINNSISDLHVSGLSMARATAWPLSCRTWMC